VNAAVVHSFDAPPRYETFPDPVPEADEVLVTVAAAGLHPIVRSLAKGVHYGSTGQLPLIPGVDGVGRTVSGSPPLEANTRVLFGAVRPPYGTFAERSVTKPSWCTPIPDELDDATVAAFINPAMSSWAALTQRTPFVPGESILILGATGAAGLLAVQIAKRFGAKRIVAAGRNPEALEETKSLGADATISLNQDRDALVSAFRDEFAKHRTDVILDYLWGAPAETLLAAVTQKGLDHGSWRIRYIQIGNVAGPTINLPAATLRSSGLELLGSGFGSVPIERIFDCLAAILKEAAKKPFQIKLTTAPLSEVEKLWNSTDDARIVFQP
jgi:NADPH2:quinone reductase